MTVIEQIQKQAEEAPSHPALIYRDKKSGNLQEYSYSDLVRTMIAHKEYLISQGCSSGERCGLLAPQGAAFIGMGLGVMAAGMCLAPVSGEYQGEALDHFITRAHLHHLLQDISLNERATRNSLSSLFSPSHQSYKIEHFKLSSAVDGQDEKVFRSLNPAYLRFTSGTTNKRKGVVLGHETIFKRLKATNKALNISRSDRILWTLPMAHHFVVSLLLYLSNGATVLLPDGENPNDILKMASDQGATFFYASPLDYQKWLRSDFQGEVKQLRLAVSTSMGLNSEVAEAFYQRFRVPLSQALGIIEVGLPIINLSASREKPLALGKPLPDYEVILENSAEGERQGEIGVRGPGLFDAYLDPWIPAENVLKKGNFQTGDQGYLDEEGNLYLLGRQANRINTGGRKFFSEEVEAVLNRHQSVVESRVWGQTDEEMGEIPVAHVVLNPENSILKEEEMREFCRQHLVHFKVPVHIDAVDHIEKTATGKIKRW